MEKEVAYKIIGKSGFGTNAIIYGENIIPELITEFPKLKKFFPIYEIGKKYKSPTNTGIFCFNSIDNANYWADNEGITKEYYRIVKVLGSNRVRSPKPFTQAGASPTLLLYSNRMSRSFYRKSNIRHNTFLSHIRCYKEIEIIEEINIRKEIK